MINWKNYNMYYKRSALIKEYIQQAVALIKC